MADSDFEIHDQFIIIVQRLSAQFADEKSNKSFAGLWPLVADLRDLARKLGYKKPPLERKCCSCISKKTSSEKILIHSCTGTLMRRVPHCSFVTEAISFNDLTWIEKKQARETFDLDQADEIPNVMGSKNSSIAIHQVEICRSSLPNDFFSKMVEILKQWETDVVAQKNGIVQLKDGLKDGLQEPDILRWKGKEYHFSKQAWLILDAVWVPGRVCVIDVDEEAFRDPEPSSKAMRQAASSLSKKLCDFGIPLVVRTKDLYFITERGSGF